MRRRRRLAPDTLAALRLRAGFLCEYCHTSERWQYVPFTVDHVVPIAQRGGGDLGNLALACFHCNRRKSHHSTSLDPDTGAEVSLFHPRQEAWADHFAWSADGTIVVGQTATGRATVALLDLNRPRIQTLRLVDSRVGRHPPPDDPVLRDP